MLAAPGMWPGRWAASLAGGRGRAARPGTPRANGHRPARPSGFRRSPPAPGCGRPGSRGRRWPCGNRWSASIAGCSVTIFRPSSSHALRPAVDQPHVVVAVHLVVPVRVRREPVVIAAVQQHRRRVGDAEPVLQCGERVGRDEVAADRVLQVGRPVHRHRVRDVAAVVRLGVLVDLDDAQAGIVEVLRHPLGRHQRATCRTPCPRASTARDRTATRRASTSEVLPIRSRGRGPLDNGSCADACPVRS